MTSQLREVFPKAVPRHLYQAYVIHVSMILNRFEGGHVRFHDCRSVQGWAYSTFARFNDDRARFSLLLLCGYETGYTLHVGTYCTCAQARVSYASCECGLADG